MLKPFKNGRKQRRIARAIKRLHMAEVVDQLITSNNKFIREYAAKH